MVIKTLFCFITEDDPGIIRSKVNRPLREVSSIEGYHNRYIHGQKSNLIVWEMDSQSLEEQVQEVMDLAEKLRSVPGDRHVSCYLIREPQRVNEFYAFLSSEVLKKYSSLDLEFNFEYVEKEPIPDAGMGKNRS